ncbi:MAG: DUF983 domain-containing protein [Alphaproteobacteria bacterium]
MQIGLACKCRDVNRGDLYKPGWTLDLRDSCEQCGLDFHGKTTRQTAQLFSRSCFLGVMIVPLAMVLDMLVHP